MFHLATTSSRLHHALWNYITVLSQKNLLVVKAECVFILVSSILYAQNYKDPLSLIMKDPENEKCEMEETKEEALMENPHLMKSALIELRNLIIKAEEYVEKVIVLIGKILK